MKHHTKDKGDIGVLKAQVDMAEQGYTILIPLTEHANFDIVAYKENMFLRVQVKYRSLTVRGTIEIPFRSYWSDKNGTHMSRTDKEAIDLFCVYCPQTDQCYYFNPKKFRTGVILRISPSKNNQKKNVQYASSFLRAP